MNATSPSPALSNPLVIGASGLVGGACFERLGRDGSTVRGTWNSNAREGLEHFSTAGDSVGFLAEHRPSLVILASALTHVDYCESHPDECRERNVEQLRPIAQWCGANRVPLVFFSSDYVFDGAAGPYAEDAAPAPISVYGRSKLDGERVVAEVPRAAIVRITNVFDIGFEDRNFLHRCVRSLRDRSPLIVPSDQYATPMYATWLADQLVTLIERGQLCADGSPRVIHAACDECVSREEFARRVTARLGADPGVIEPRTTAALAQAAPRPLRGGLTNTLWKSLLQVGRLALDDALDDCLPRMRKLYDGIR